LVWETPVMLLVIFCMRSAIYAYPEMTVLCVIPLFLRFGTLIAVRCAVVEFCVKYVHAVSIVYRYEQVSEISMARYSDSY